MTEEVLYESGVGVAGDEATGAVAQPVEAQRSNAGSVARSGIGSGASAFKLSDLPTHEEVLAEHLDADPEYRREWERTALARAVAVKVIAYRAEQRCGSARTHRRAR